MEFKNLLEKVSPALRYIARKHLIYDTYDEEDLYQEMCVYLWQSYGYGLPVGINESYAIKGCEFHIQNFLRKGKPKAAFSSIDELISPDGLTLGDVLEDTRELPGSRIEENLTISELNGLPLTDKERSVLSYLLKGCTMRETAQELGISHVMVVKHKKSIIKKWNERRLPKP